VSWIIRVARRQAADGGAAESFLKHRSIPTTKDGIAAGLVPITDNPADLVLLKLREMHRYLFAQKILKELRKKKLVKFVKATRRAPDGYARIDDRVAVRYGPRTVTGPNGSAQVYGLHVLGQYWAPEPVATVLNNYLSPGLRGNPIYDAYMGLGNTMNQAQLGLSWFHLGMTTIDTMVSQASLGLEQMVGGGGLGPVARGIGNVAGFPIAPFRSYMRGSRVLSEYLRPSGGTSPAGAELAAVVDALIKGGGRARQDAIYHNEAVKNLRAAIDDLRQVLTHPSLGVLDDAAAATARAVWHAIASVFELVSKPIMEVVVPRYKLGVFADLARHELAKLPANATRDDVRRVMGEAWDAVDNRLGQMVYDNLFWHKTLKDVAMASTRAVGWNLGSLRLLVDGSAELLRGARQAGSGRRPRMSHDAYYLVMLPIVVGLLGAIYQYLSTGRGPQEGKDLFFPRTGRKDAAGNPDRVQLPSYLRDFFAYRRAPYETLKHKLHPLIGTIADLLENEDYYGDMLRNPKDPAGTQARQVGKFLAKQFLPIGIQSATEQAARGEPIGVRVQNAFGITAAPREAVRTPAQNLMSEFLRRRRASQTTPEDAERAAARREVVMAARRDPAEARGDVRAAVADGTLTREQGRQALKNARRSPLVGQFKQLTLDEALDVYEKADARERRVFRPLLMVKARNAEPADRRDARRRLRTMERPAPTPTPARQVNTGTRPTF
jgi:hypothetical protein